MLKTVIKTTLEYLLLPCFQPMKLNSETILMDYTYLTKKRNSLKHIGFLAVSLFAPVATFAQEEGAEATRPGFIDLYSFEIAVGLLILFAVIAIFAIINMGSRLFNLTVEEVASKTGEDAEQLKDRVRLFPAIFPTKSKSEEVVSSGNRVVKLKQGQSISIDGEASAEIKQVVTATHSIQPVNFRGMIPIPKVEVKEGDKVKAGDVIFFDKKNPDVLYTSPVSGEFIELRRGPKRRIDELVILADQEQEFKDFGTLNVQTASAEDIKSKLVDSGAWPLMLQRPFNVVADLNATPKNIHISCFDSAPLAVDTTTAIARNTEAFQAGISALSKLTTGTVHLGANQDADNSALNGLADCEITEFKGEHPAGNVGVQIHHIDPINKGDIVWTVDPQHVIIIGRLFLTGKYDTRKLFSIAGSSLKDTFHVEAPMGVNLKSFIEGNTTSDHVRVISGDVLTGTTIAADGHIGFFHNGISVIEEGDQEELFGWLLPSYPRPTVSPTFFSYFHSGEKLAVNTNTHGEERAFVVTGRYEEVLPMDVLPMQLFKAILSEDFEKMEGLGLYELVEEDVALCEFVCPSKSPIQEIVTQGIELLRKG